VPTPRKLQLKHIVEVSQDGAQGVHLERRKNDPKISRRSVGSHENPTDSEFPVTRYASGQSCRKYISPAR
jgi:hypothetical protein